uniref:T9SS type A sorting domain-containing protein n=1 Tax=candidate division WOR-3 bacterium TaxID=2052148 RepID=A0A7V1EGY2_UNCW3
MDKTSSSSEYDIFWKTYPGQPLHNLSNTPEIGSNYPHTSLRFIETQNPPVQYTVWQEGDVPYYNIKTTQTVIDLPNNFCGISTLQPAYFTTAPGFKTPSLHLVQRDSFVAHWNIPVDIGRQRVKYNFRLEPDYCYKLQMIAYHEGSGIWKMRVKIDSEEIGEIMFNAYEPETLVTVISPSLYADSTINLTSEAINGNYASVGPVYIYRYENGQRSSKSGPPSGPMVYEVHSSQDSAIIIYSNPFQNLLKVDTRSLKNISIRAAIYDVSGRFIKKLYEGKASNNSVIKWDCTDRNGRMVSPGVYFLTIEKIGSGDRLTNKVIMVR